MRKPSDSPVKVLLADDSVTMHRAVALALKRLPWELLTCDNGQDAYRLTLEQRPDVVIADLDMPGMSGAELCQAIRAKPTLARTKIILLCGSFDQVDESRIEKIPADGRLWKPFESHVLTALIEALLKNAAATAAREGGADPTLGTPKREPTASQTIPPLPPAPPPRLPSYPTGSVADVVRDMTSETFRVHPSATSVARLPDELPEPAERTLPPYVPPLPQFPGVWAGPGHAPLPSGQGATSLKENYLPVADGTHQEPEDLWNPNVQFAQGVPKPQGVETLGNPRSPTLMDPFPNTHETQSTGTPYFELPPGEDNENDIPFASIPDQRMSQLELAPEADHESVNLDFSLPPLEPMPETRFEIPALPSLEPVAPRTASSDEDLRALVRQEVDRALSSWFREKLEKKLAEVLAEIDRA